MLHLYVKVLLDPKVLPEQPEQQVLRAQVVPQVLLDLRQIQARQEQLVQRDPRDPRDRLDRRERIRPARQVQLDGRGRREFLGVLSARDPLDPLDSQAQPDRQDL